MILKVLAILYILAGVPLLLGAVRIAFEVQARPEWTFVGYIASVIFGLFGLAGLAVGLGVLRFRNWARRLAMAEAAGLMGCSVLWFAGGDLDELKLLVSLSWYGLIIWYFMRPSVKAQFARTAS